MLMALNHFEQNLETLQYSDKKFWLFLIKKSKYFFSFPVVLTTYTSVSWNNTCVFVDTVNSKEAEIILSDFVNVYSLLKNLFQ